MHVPKPLDPFDVLERLSRRLGPREAECFALDEAPAGYLAEPIELSSIEGVVAGGRDKGPSEWSGRDPSRWAIHDGYAIHPRIAAGSVHEVLGVLTRREVLDPFGRTLASPTDRGALLSVSGEHPGGPPTVAFEGGAPREGAGREGTGRASTGREGTGREGTGREGTGRASTGPGVWRVEPGALLPPDSIAVVRPERVSIVGTARVRFEAIPEAGQGIIERETTLPRATAGKMRIARGTFLGPRLRGAIEACGVSQVSMRRPPRVAWVSIERSESSGASAAEGAGGTPESRNSRNSRDSSPSNPSGDLGPSNPSRDSKSRRRSRGSAPSKPGDSGAAAKAVTAALSRAVEALGLEGMDLGSLDSEPRSLHGALLRARDRRVDVLVLFGGLGQGIECRTRESLERVECDFVVEGSFHPLRAEFAWGRVHGFDVIASSEAPLSAMAILDVILVPGLMASMGASRSRWDWRYQRAESVTLRGRPARYLEADRPAILPASRVVSSGGEPVVEAWEPELPFLPLSGPQDGWVVIGPSESPVGPRCLGHYIACGP